MGAAGLARARELYVEDKVIARQMRLLGLDRASARLDGSGRVD